MLTYTSNQTKNAGKETDMKRNETLFLIYARLNDGFVLKARYLKASEVTARANEIQEKDRCDVLILEDDGRPERPERKEADGRRKALAAVKNLRVIDRKGKRA